MNRFITIGAIIVAILIVAAVLITMNSSGAQSQQQQLSAFQLFQQSANEKIYGLSTMVPCNTVDECAKLTAAASASGGGTVNFSALYSQAVTGIAGLF